MNYTEKQCAGGAKTKWFCLCVNFEENKQAGEVKNRGQFAILCVNFTGKPHVGEAKYVSVWHTGQIMGVKN